MFLILINCSSINPVTHQNTSLTGIACAGPYIWFYTLQVFEIFFFFLLIRGPTILFCTGGPTNYIACPAWKIGPAGFLVSCISRARQGGPRPSLLLPVVHAAGLVGLGLGCPAHTHSSLFIHPSSPCPLVSPCSPTLPASAWQPSSGPLAPPAASLFPFPAVMVEALCICEFAVMNMDTVFSSMEITVACLNPKK